MESTLEISNTVSTENPMGTDGFELVEFASAQPDILAEQFKNLGFNPTAKHRQQNVTLFQQGDINFILNAEPNSFAAKFSFKHGPCACAMGFRVKDANYAYQRALKLGARAFEDDTHWHGGKIPAIYGIGDSILYFVDRYGDKTLYDNDFIPITDNADQQSTAGLTYLDHLTHNVFRGHMDEWANFYKRFFNFHLIRSFEISGKHTGLRSHALASPCGKIKIPLNESTDGKSQIEEYLEEYKGEGIQHIALATDNIYETIEELHRRNVSFLYTPTTYFDMLNKRLPNHHEDFERLKRNGILMDGTTKTQPPKLLLQIFTNIMVGPIFYEIIQRKGDEGFGEGNFQALFDSIELEQIQRGYLKT